MAEGDASIYNHFKEQILLGAIDCSGDTFKIMLLGAGYSFSPDGNNGYANVSAQEISPTAGYSAGGETLTGLTVTQNDTGDYAKWDAGNVTWSSLATAVIDNAIIYDDTITTPVAKPLCVHFVIETDSNGGDYSLNFNAGGILQVS